MRWHPSIRYWMQAVIWKLFEGTALARGQRRCHGPGLPEHASPTTQPLGRILLTGCTLLNHGNCSVKCGCDSLCREVAGCHCLNEFNKTKLMNREWTPAGHAQDD